MLGRRFIVIVAAGTGSRFGSSEIEPKAFHKINGASLLAHSAKTINHVLGLSACVCVVPQGFQAHAEKEIAAQVIFAQLINEKSIFRFTYGGAQRNDSVRCGITRLNAEFSLTSSDTIAIHDAARCLVTTSVFEKCFAQAELSGAATAAAPVRDTIKRVKDTGVAAAETISRQGLYGMQTPQVFRYDLLQKALSLKDAALSTDEVSLVAQIAPVTIVETSHSNFKITYAEDIELAQAVLAARRY